MQQVKRTILSTRDISQMLIAAAAEHGIAVEVSAFIATRPLRSVALEKEIRKIFRRPGGTYVFTSKNAAGAAGEYFRETAVSAGVPDIYCLENSTLDTVRKYFPAAKIKGAAADASSLADLMLQDKKTLQDKKNGSVVFFCGNKRRDTLPEKLRISGINLLEITVYETIETPSAATGNYEGILFFSPSAVSSFFRVNRPGRETVCFATGNTTAAALKEHTGYRIVESREPGAAALINTAIAYFDKINRQE